MMRMAAFLAPAALLALSGCGDSGKEENLEKEVEAQLAPSPSASSPAGPEAEAGLSLSDGVLVLPAVSGRPGAAYFTLRNNGEKVVTLSAAHVEGAEKTEMHETKGGMMSPVKDLGLDPGRSLEFTRGRLHVMAFGLSDTLKPGGKTEITLVFADGDKLSAPVAIQAAGQMTTGAAMDHHSGEAEHSH